MAHVTTIPSESDFLCEGCGYVLHGLPDGSRCPECGKPAGESAATLRQLPPWERGPDAGNGWLRFLRTTTAVTFRPTRFFRTLSVQPIPQASRQFARIYWLLSSALFGAAAWAHLHWSMYGNLPRRFPGRWIYLPVAVAFAYVMIAILYRIAARLTAWEASLRGIRLPLPVIRRGLDYHAAHYLPVALLGCAAVWGYQAYLRWDLYRASQYGTVYLYTLCGLVVALAYYVFKTYWIAMRNLMYANRDDARS